MNGIYSRLLNQSIKAFSQRSNLIALVSADKALDYALYEMMEPITSGYVQRVQTLRHAIYSDIRFEKYLAQNKE